MHLYRYMHYNCLFNSKSKTELSLAQSDMHFLEITNAKSIVF